jgi:hypothetical protein
VYIFTLYAEVLDNPLLPSPPWLPITHVCRHWRTITLSHGSLWTSITRGLSLRWIKAFMVRSGTMLMDFDIHVSPSPEPDNRACLCHEDTVLLLADFTRVRSLSLTGYDHTISPIINSLRSLPHLQSLTLCLENRVGPPYRLPDNLLGGKASVRRLQLLSRYGHTFIVAPHWLLRGVTHFTISEITAPPDILKVLRNMPTLAYFEFRGCFVSSSKLGTSPIQMPQLMDLTVRTNSLEDFVLLNQLLLLPVGAKRRMELSTSGFYSSFRDRLHRYPIGDLLPVVEAANGFQHFHFFEAPKEGWFRLWTGNAVTTWEDAELCLHVEWRELWLTNLDYFMEFCEMLGAARVRRLVIDSPSSGLSKSYWSMLFDKLPGVEELELYPASVDTWKEIGDPAMLPALRSVRVADSGLDHHRPSTQYLWTRRHQG